MIQLDPDYKDRFSSDHEMFNYKYLATSILSSILYDLRPGKLSEVVNTKLNRQGEYDRRNAKIWAYSDSSKDDREFWLSIVGIDEGFFKSLAKRVESGKITLPRKAGIVSKNRVLI